MSDTPQSGTDLSRIYEERRKTRDAEIALYNEVDNAIKGILNEEYSRLFTDKDVKLQLRTIRQADDGLTKFLSEIPILPHADVLGKREGDKPRSKAETVEKVCYGYHNGSAMRGGTEFDGIRFQLARHQVRFGDGCLVIHPDFQNRLVFFEVKDPRCLYLPTGWHPWSITPLDGALLVTEMTLGECKARYGSDPEVYQRLNNAYSKKYGWNNDTDDTQIIKVGFYRSKEAWLVSAMGDTDVRLVESHTGDRNHPGVCGVTSFKQFASEPLFLGQIGIEAGLMKVVNQQIQNTERINKAPIVGPPLVGDTLRWGEYNVIDMSNPNAQRFTPQRLAPDSPTNLTQVMGSLLQLAQMFNYNPEAMSGAGDANSGKALQQLMAGPRSLVTNILFTPYKVAFPRAYDDAMQMELNLWPNERKTAQGTKGRQSFEVDYTPSSALQGYKGRVKIEEPRMGGYNAFLEALQKKDAGMASLRDVLEKDPDIRDVDSTIRRIELESVEKLVSAAFEGLGGQDPLLAIRAAAEVSKQIGEGKSKSEAIQAVIKSGLLDPPEPEAAPGGMPPEVAQLMSSGMGGPLGPPPSLSDVAV